jgi:hypothetical protein
VGDLLPIRIWDAEKVTAFHQEINILHEKLTLVADS